MVAKLYEALMIREAELRLGVLNMDVLFTDDQYRSGVNNNVTQTIYTREDADKLNKAAKALDRKAKVFVKVDTGLNRVGVNYTDAADLVEYIHGLSEIQVLGIFSTFM
jgi:alanine racemase